MAPAPFGISPKTGNVYVPASYITPETTTSALMVISGQTNKVVRTLLDKGQPFDAVVSPRTGDVYVGYGEPSGANEILVLSGKTNKLITTIQDSLPIAGLAVSPRNGDVYVANSGHVQNTGTVTVISGKTNKVIATIPDHHYYPWSIAVSPRTGDIYVANINGEAGGAGSIVVITTVPPRTRSAR
jgi:YVTN family beta-propeller protein